MSKAKLKGSGQKITIKAKNPRKIKSALKAWVQSAEQNACDPFNLDKAPAWAENALAEAVKTTFPGHRLPTSGEWDMELIGEIFGRQQAIAKLYAGEIPMGPQVEAEYQKLEKLASSQPLSPEKAAVQKDVLQDLATIIGATNQAIPQLMASALGSSHEDAVQFQKGLLRGMSLAPDELATGNVFQRHTRTFWVLGTQWQMFVQCGSVGKVHRTLCNAIGETKIGSLKTFERDVAKKIGMKFRRSGRPPQPK